MAPIKIPAAGIPLSEFPTADTGFKKSRTPQAIRIECTGGDSMDQIIGRIRSGVEVSVSLGKKPVCLLFGGVSEELTCVQIRFYSSTRRHIL